MVTAVMKSQQIFNRMQVLTFIPQNTDALFLRRFSPPATPHLRIVRREDHLEFLRVSRQLGASEGWVYATLGACALSGVIAAFARATM
jgi:hypothetical protein